MKLAKTAAGTLAFAAASVLAVPAAIAAPDNAKNSSTFELDCDGTDYTVVVNGNGSFSPGFIVGTNDVFIPYTFDITFTAGGFSESESEAKKNIPNDAITCDLSASGTFPDEETGEPIDFTGSGTVTGRIV